MKKQLQRLFRFIRHEVWTINVQTLNKRNRYMLRLFRIVMLAIENFSKKNLILQASALTFYSLLSVIPVAAVIFGIAKGFGLEGRLQSELYIAFANQPEVLKTILGFVQSLLDNTQGGLMALTGLAILLWSVIQVLSSIEEAFNTIWQIKGSRTWTRKFTDYLAIMMLAPIFIITSGSVTIFIQTNITEFANERIYWLFVRSIVVFSINLIPYFLSALLFMILYIVMPNTKVKFSSAMVAGMIAGFSFQLFQWIYIESQVGVSRANAIYGSFAFFPLFLIFLQTSWVIVLIGAEISYSVQNIDLQVHERQEFRPSHKLSLALSLAIMHEVVERFVNEKAALEAEEVAARLNIPYKMVKENCFKLEKAGLLNEIVTDEKDNHAFQPAVSPDKITPAYIVERLDKTGESLKDYKDIGIPVWSQNLTDQLYVLMNEEPLNKNILDNPKP